MPALRIRRSSRSATLLLVPVLLAPFFGPSAAVAQTDPRQQRDEVRRQRAAAAQEIDALRANDTAVRQALADIEVNLNGQLAALDDARRVEAQANEAVAQARAREHAVLLQIDAIKSELRAIAVRAYVDGGAVPASFDATGAADLSDLERQTLVKLQANRHVTLGDQLRAAEEDLTAARRDAEASAALAAQKRSEVQQRVAEVDAARQQQQAFAGSVETRLDQRLSEAAQLASVDQRLSNEIAAQEAALAARLPKTTSGGGGGAPVGNVPLATVRGITVAASIADQLDRMLAAAESDGIVFGGSGYRDSSSQQALRQRNCPDPVNSPPSACRPPTARPGASMHERGLAIDFTYNGAVIDSHANAGYQWLAAHAGAFGFANLPSEPWHWSTNGT